MDDIKKCFISRFGENGKLVEMDYSQLEVIGAAVVSGDPNMKEDILAGIDSHSQSASWLSSYSYDEVYQGYMAGDANMTALRKKSKGPRFELQYGAGYKAIARNNGISEAVAKGFVEQYYDRYYVLKEFQNSVIKEVESTLLPSDKYFHGQRVQGGLYVSITGRCYFIEQDEAPEFLKERGIMLSISPTKCKNYPMQGFATGDIVPMMLGKVHRKLIEINKERSLPHVLLINTVHDSMVFDVNYAQWSQQEIHNAYIQPIKQMLESVPECLEEHFGIHTDLPFNVGVEIGDNLAEMSAYNL